MPTKTVREQIKHLVVKACNKTRNYAGDIYFDDNEMADIPQTVNDIFSLHQQEVDRQVRRAEVEAGLKELNEVWADDGIHNAVAMYGRVDANTSVMDRIKQLEAERDAIDKEAKG